MRVFEDIVIGDTKEVETWLVFQDRLPLGIAAANFREVVDISVNLDAEM
jgi:hypothetical protein